MLKFKEWLLTERSNTGAKTGLFPLGYGGIGLYPPQWYITKSADAIFYLSKDDRIYNFKTKQMVSKGLNTGDGGLWDISHIPGDIKKPKEDKKNGFAANCGEGGMWNIKHIEGSPSYKKNKELVPDEGDGGIWNIKHIPGSCPKQNSGEGGTWNIKHLKGDQTKCKANKDPDFKPNSGEGGMWDIKKTTYPQSR
jgi:hypothetical protein